MDVLIGFICGLIFGAFTGLAACAILAIERDQEQRDMQNYERYKEQVNNDRVHKLWETEEGNTKS